MRYWNWIRQRHFGQGDDWQRVVAGEGRKLLGEVMDTVKRMGLFQHRMSRTLDDGTLIVARFDGTTPIVEVTRPPKPAPSLPILSSVWIPRGFVVLPVTDEAPFGWGLPIVADTSSGSTAYSATNLSPGLGVARWTAAGPLGEVLLTRVADAGYPRAHSFPPPIAFNTVVGPAPKAKPATRPDVEADHATGPWAAHRLEFTAFDDVPHVPKSGQRRAGFELLNAHRTGMGLHALNLPLRGYYSTAQTYADMCAQTGAYGHYSPLFWRGYKTPAERASKDGMPDLQSIQVSYNPNDRNFADFINENLLVQASSFTPGGTDPNGELYGHVAGPVEISPLAALNGWLGSAPHRATIENVVWNGHSSFADIGLNAFWTQTFQRRNQWIGCGNAYWHSSHEEIPALSWHSFPTRNLTFETYPIKADFTGVSTMRVCKGFDLLPSSDAGVLENRYAAILEGGELHDAMSVIVWDDAHTVADLAALTITPAVPHVVDTAGIFHYAIRNTADAGNTDFEYVQPCLTGSVFMRGRCIALAPNGGLVLAAAIEKIVPNLSTQPTKYRLKIIAHEQADQPLDGIQAGMMSVVHLYHCDLDDKRGFAAHAEAIIKGVRGHPVGTWPWNDADDVWSWVDDGTIAVNSTTGGEPDMLRYQCMWRFNAAGTQAACLREQAKLDKIKRIVYAQRGTYTTFDMVARPPSPPDFIPVYEITYRGYLETYFTFFGPTRTLKLSYRDNGHADLEVLPLPALPTMQDALLRLGTPSAVPLPSAVRELATSDGKYAYSGYHYALDYDASGELKYLAHLTLDGSVQSRPFAVTPGYERLGVVLNMYDDFGDSFGSVFLQSRVLAKGSFDAASVEDFDQVIATGWTGRNRSLVFGVADVNDFVVMQVDYNAYAITVKTFGGGAQTVVQNPTGSCWTAQIYVETYRDGSLIDRSQVPNHGVVCDPVPTCPNPLVYRRMACRFVTGASTFVQPSYARNRRGDWVTSHNVSAQKGVPQILTDAVCSDDWNVSLGTTCWPAFWQLYGDTSVLPQTTPVASAVPLGGWMSSSFGDQAALAAKMKLQGANARCVYARVV